MKLSIIILAAGRGSRMQSALPKVLHTIAGMSMLERIVRTAQRLDPADIFVIHGQQGDYLRHALPTPLEVTWIEQKELLGTGHAVLQATPKIADEHSILVLYGDVPCISLTTLQRLLATMSEHSVGLVTAQFADPAELGRIVRDSCGNFLQIVEHKEATAAQRNITEVNSGICCFPARFLKFGLKNISSNNAQKEYYLTDIFALAVQHGLTVATVLPEYPQEAMGVNDRWQLATLERSFQARAAHQLMARGVTLRDPARIDIRGEIEAAEDVILDINVILIGTVILGRGCSIGPHCILQDCVLGEGVVVEAHSILEGACVEAGAHIGPFARLRPGSHVQSQSRIGNFVEIKNSQIGTGSKINHLSYIGDADVGANVNVGAGTITCNYDGKKKHKTKIGAGAFIGSGTELVAPLEIGEGAFIGAGSTITDNAPAHALTLTRAPQCTHLGWKEKRLEKKDREG